MRRHRLRSWVPPVLAFAMLAGAEPSAGSPDARLTNSVAAVPPLAWGACPEAWIGSSANRLGSRLQCAAMAMPLDHLAPDGRLIEVGVLRVSAAIPAQREGAIFLNGGGPGLHPGALLHSLAAAWTSMRPHDPDEADKRGLAERYDLVAVIPRGQVGAGPIHCRTGLAPRFQYLPTHTDDTNWNLVLAEARDIAQACSAPGHARYVSTEQHAHDMDAIRHAIGDDRVHFYGISYGSMVGARYASLYPEHLDRMILDSPLDFTRDYRAATVATLEARQKRYVETVVAPLLDDPARYGLGSDSGAVSTSIAQLPGDIREAMAGYVESPVQLAAALHAASWMRQDPVPTFDRFRQIIQSAPLAVEAATAIRVRMEAARIARALYVGWSTEPHFSLGAEAASIRTIVPCNDVNWTRSDQEIRQAAQQYAARYFNIDGTETLDELVCSRWGGSAVRTLDLVAMEGARRFLLIQSEKDSTTPLNATTRILDRFNQARMLLVRDSDLHGVFNYTRSPCIERTAAHYLLTGALPESGSRVLACDGTLGNPLHAIPGEPHPPFTAPVPVPVLVDGSSTAAHDELRR
ncbi:alpha/beta fold hydrolase [Luteibacter yeojuensis]|uniref:Alpha/beta hydrolase n=1 Tax=Luteibacter yeojuensis TaxID=345309 RepID=A0A7X5TRE6_9GAMM|nr:alpha/beta hydrolase [Luteibacter yeojuensis]NID16457.1 alpha/beta hydrolase [Luteibacter yeojuensis]